MSWDGDQYQQVPGDYGSTSLHLVADDTGAYFTSALGGLRAFHPDSGQRDLLPLIPGPAVVSLAVGPSDVFISTDDVGSATEPTLLRVSKDGSSSSVLIEQSGGVITDGTAFDSLRVQGDYVYFVQDFVNQDPDGFLTRVLRVPVQGGEPELIGEMDREPGYDWIRLYSNGEHLYVLRRDGVRRRCLPP